MVKSQKRFFRQYLSEDGDAAYWWQYVLRPEEKADYTMIKELFLQRYGTKAIAARSQFEIQNEVMALRQSPGESIASYVRTAEKLSKRVPAELDSVLALCLIKGMQDEVKKGDISYIVHSRKETTFRDVIGIMKAKYRVIGEPDPFGKGDMPKSTNHWWTAYVAPGVGSTVIPVVAAAGQMGSIPTYNVGKRMIADSLADIGSRLNDKLYGEDGLAGTMQGCGISHLHFKGLMDWYFHEKANETLANTKTEDFQAPLSRQDFRQPALPTPGVNTLAQGDQQAAVINTSTSRTGGLLNNVPASPNVSCFSCARRGHYSTTCPYPPLPPHEQEHLREAARISRLQRAGLPAASMNSGGPLAVNIVSMNEIESQRKEDIVVPVALTHMSSNVLKVDEGLRVETKKSPAVGSRVERISSACAILSRLLPVLAIIQDVMAGKRTRTQDDEGTEWIPAERQTKAPRMQQTDAETIDRGNKESGGEDILDSVVVRPTTGDGGRTAMRSFPDKEAETRARRASTEESDDVMIEEVETPTPSPIVVLSPGNTDSRNHETGDRSRNSLPFAADLERDAGVQVPEWLQRNPKKTAKKAMNPVPMNLMKGLDPYRIAEAMVRIKPEISFPQLLDVSPRLRRELALLLRWS